MGRIALPMISFAGRCLAVLATPPHNLLTKSGAEGGTRTRALDVGNVASWPLDDFRPHKIMERAARVELASSGWRPEAPAAIPCSPFTLGRGDRIRTCLNSFWRRAPFPSGHHPCSSKGSAAKPRLLRPRFWFARNGAHQKLTLYFGGATESRTPIVSVTGS